MIHPDTIQAVFEQANTQAQEIIGQYMELKKGTAKSLVGCCPFHKEKTASFHVYVDGYKCFGCGESGSAVQFIMNNSGIDYPTAIREIAKKYSIEVKETGQQENNEERLKREALYKLMNDAQSEFEVQLSNEYEPKKYMIGNRNYADKTMQHFGIGYCHKGAISYVHLSYIGHSVKDMIKVGLIPEKSQYARYADRITFPIHSPSGKLISFAGRIYSKSQAENKKLPKYINGPATTLYDKSKVLYNLHRALPTIRKQKNVYLVEGYTDVISLYQFTGIENVVACCGTAFTEHHAKLLRRHTDRITLFFDGDKAGRKAIARTLPVVLAHDFIVYVISTDKDPDELSRHLQEANDPNPGEYIYALRLSFMDYIYNFLSTYTGEKYMKAAERAAQLIGYVPDEAKQEMYLNQLAEAVNVEKHKISKWVAKQSKSDKHQTSDIKHKSSILLGYYYKPLNIYIYRVDNILSDNKLQENLYQHAYLSKTGVLITDGEYVNLKMNSDKIKYEDTQQEEISAEIQDMLHYIDKNIHAIPYLPVVKKQPIPKY